MNNKIESLFEFNVSSDNLVKVANDLLLACDTLEGDLAEINKLFLNTINKDIFSGQIADLVSESWQLINKNTSLSIEKLKNIEKLKTIAEKYASADIDVANKISEVEVL